MTREALHDVTREGQRLREYISVIEVVLDAMDGEATKAKATMTATQVELAGELNSIFLFCWIFILVRVTLSFTLLVPRHSGATGCRTGQGGRPMVDQ